MSLVSVYQDFFASKEAMHNVVINGLKIIGCTKVLEIIRYKGMFRVVMIDELVEA